MFPRSRTLAQADPELWAAIAAENQRQEDHIELIASENYASPAVMAAQGSQLTNKYAEGYPGQALLRRLRVRRHRRAARDRSREEALRRRCGERAAAFRRAGEPGGLLRGAEARRHDPRDVAAARRAPDARLAGQHQRQVVQGRSLRPRPRDRADRLRRGRAARAGAQAEADHRRRVGLFARHRLEAFPRDRRRGRRAADGRHGALRGAGRRRRLSDAGRHRRLRHQHHAQDAARPARRLHPRGQPSTKRRSTPRSSPDCRAGR